VKAKSFMLIAGEASGDTLAAELVGALRQKVVAGSLDSTADVQPLRTALVPRFFGAGGPKMAAAGVELAFDMIQHSVVGVSDAAGKGPAFLRRLLHLRQLAIWRQPDAIILVDFSFFNHTFARVLRWYLRGHRSPFNNWSPKLVKYVSPQVWASRPGRAYRMPEDFDLLLSIFPFEKEWYARRVPKLRVEFVGHPMIGRSLESEVQSPKPGSVPTVLLLPGSRVDEVRRHLPVVTGALELLRRDLPGLRAKMVLPNEALLQSVKTNGLPSGLELQVGGIPAALAEADLAITKSGTITMECATLGVPAVVFYKTSWPTYLIGRRIVKVKYLAMPNLLAGEEIYPEFVQDAATAQSISRAALQLLRDETRRAVVKAKLAAVVASLGKPGAASRAADAICSLMS
jgi:lipid-A-disaccharide synthase